MLPRLIGIAGKAGAGKDTLADQLVRQHGYAKYSLAAPIKKMLNELFGWKDESWRDRQWKELPAIAGVYTQGGNWSLDEPYVSPRHLAQWLGTEVGRTIGGEDVWINLMEREWKQQTFLAGPKQGYQPRMVVPDVRFDNEARRIRALGGVIIQINRPTPYAVPAHASEKGVDASLVHVFVGNDCDVIEFLQRCTSALERLA